jgi:hypothetical protein
LIDVVHPCHHFCHGIECTCDDIVHIYKHHESTSSTLSRGYLLYVRQTCLSLKCSHWHVLYEQLCRPRHTRASQSSDHQIIVMKPYLRDLKKYINYYSSTYYSICSRYIEFVGRSIWCVSDVYDTRSTLGCEGVVSEGKEDEGFVVLSYKMDICVETT